MNKHFFNHTDIDLTEFKQICSQNITKKSAQELYSHAETIISNVLIYDGDQLRLAQENLIENHSLKNELYHGLFKGPGVLVIKKFFKDLSTVDRNTELFYQIIAEEEQILKQQGKLEGDHFAKGGANKRIWNALEKIALRDPEAFISYYKNPLFKFISETWLGLGYQITAQVNLVKPGGRAQTPHRDYHLGFQNNETIASYPEAFQVASQMLTLQGAVAHSDIPKKSGSTYLLPFSQQYSLGYLACKDQGFIDYFTSNRVQLPLEKGDGLFFSPALFHGAGDNDTENHQRLVNLFQVSSALAKPTESVNRIRMMFLLYPSLVQKWKDHTINELELTTAINCIADGYAFPTNLDATPPTDAISSETPQKIMKTAIIENWNKSKFEEEVMTYQKNHLS